MAGPRPVAVVDRRNRLAGEGRVFSLAALDAHARIGSDSNGDTRGASVHFPSYATLFRTVAQAVPLEQPLTGNALADSRLILDAIHERKSFAIVRGFANVLTPLRVDVRDGDVIGGDVPGVPEAKVTVFPIAPGRYRLEARLPGTAFPWLVSDVVDLRPEMPATATDHVGPPVNRTGPVVPASEWRIEKHPTSSGTIQTLEDGLLLSYTLGAGEPAGQYVALSAPAGAEPIERIEFTASARAPMRISLQVRVPGGTDGQRWGRSIYLDRSTRNLSVPLADLQPIDRRTALRPVVARVQSVLIVVDTLNAKPGSSGEITLKDVRFVRGQAPPSRKP
jgi:hypothetical protein